MENAFDAIVIGGGQSGLALGYYLRRTGLVYTILDDQSEPGGAWQHTWQSLRLFSPAQWSSLPGMLMTGGADYYPTRNEAIDYLAKYEAKYALPIRRGVKVYGVYRDNGGFTIKTSAGPFYTKAVVSATGSFANPYTPNIPGRALFRGTVLHSSEYTSPEPFRGKRVAIVGEGNSGAQVLAEVSKVAPTLWVTQQEPSFLADDIDGRFLFDVATQLYDAQKNGRHYTPPSLGHIVMVDTVKEARTRGVFASVRPFDRFTEDALVWADGREEKVDVVIFCTGFKSALDHLAPLNVMTEQGRVATEGTRCKEVDGLWLVGYGNWTGFASATLIGVGRSAKATVDNWWHM